MNFKILCRSFEARTKPYQIKLEISLKVINTPAPQYFLTV